MIRKRICKICNEEFETKKASWRCQPCINQLSNERRKKEIEERKAAGLYRGNHGRPKDLEGQDYEGRMEEWRLRRKYLDEIYDRDEWRAYFVEQFERIESDKELWRCLTRPTLAEDIRGVKSVKPKQRGVIGRPKSESRLYPDTRNVNIDDTTGYRMGKD